MKCDVCGKVFKRRYSQVVKYGNHYCGDDCKKRAMEIGVYFTPEALIRMRKKKKVVKGKYSEGSGHYNSAGYVVVYHPDHPNKKSGGCILKHRLVMEKYLGRYLKPEEVVHHINGDKKDNRIENLMLFKNDKEHRHYHEKLKQGGAK